MKVNVDLVLQLRKANAWSQDELATAAGLNLRTIQRIESEATASLQSMKALASALGVKVHDLEHERPDMINELLGKQVTVVTTYIGAIDSVKGELLEIRPPWIKIVRGGKPVYIHLNQIVRIAPQ